jgi:putative Mn2+ efflux pump MntP
MDLIAVFFIAIGLAMDAFSVCISAGICIPEIKAGHYIRLALTFGFFQFLMPLIGYAAGVTVEPVIKSYDHWIAFALLCYIGGKMIHEGLKKKSDECETRDPSRGKTLLILAIATSIDALAVGLSFGVLSKPIIVPAIIIGVVCIAFSALGVLIGKKAGELVGKKGEIIGGLCLIAIGAKIILEHLF